MQIVIIFRVDCDCINRKPVLTLFTKNPCPLCDVLKEELVPFGDRFELKTVDIELPENKKWHQLYRYEIPVLFLNDEYLCKHRLDTRLLEMKLKEIE